MLDVEEEYSVMTQHSHEIIDTTDYLAPPPIPPEEFDPPDAPDAVSIISF